MTLLYATTEPVTLLSATIAPARGPSYDQIRELERRILRDCAPVECEVAHHFADQVYGREMRIPAGTVLTGKIHRHATLNILAQGTIRVTTADGSVRELTAPAVFVSPPGCKKVGLALTDVVWINAHPNITNTQDLDAIEAAMIEPEAPLLSDDGNRRIEA